jgi:hypothetical protein
MAMKPHIHRELDKQGRRGWYRLRRRRDDVETTRQYSEQDLQNLAHQQGTRAGIIRPETGDLRLPAGLEESSEGRQANAPPKVMLIIITLALLFIAIITYFVSQMPAKN